MDGNCAPRFYDSDAGGSGELEPGCWAAHALGDSALTQICDDGRSMVVPQAGEQSDKIDVPTGVGGATALAKTVYDSGVVRVDTPRCRSADALRVNGDELVPLVAHGEFSNASVAPLGVLPGGRVVLHYNSDAGCGHAAPSPGVYIFDPDTGEQRVVWRGAAALGDAQMWAPAGSALN